VDNIFSIKATNKEATNLEVSEEQGMIHFRAHFTDGTARNGEMPYYFLWRKWLSTNATLQDEIFFFRKYPEILETLYESFRLIKREKAEVWASNQNILRYREYDREMDILYRDDDGHICLFLDTYGGKIGQIIFVEATDFFGVLKKLLE